MTMTVTVKGRVRGMWKARYWGLMLRVGQFLRLDEDILLRWFRNGTRAIRVEVKAGNGPWHPILPSEKAP